MDSLASPPPPPPPPPPKEPPASVLARRPIAIGTTCVIYSIPGNKVLKCRPSPNPNDDFATRAFEIEITCYNR
ncbi:hypothetical protein BDV19DRAFT_314997 [Aspergillus venezuelensis]